MKDYNETFEITLNKVDLVIIRQVAAMHHLTPRQELQRIVNNAITNAVAQYYPEHLNTYVERRTGLA